MNRNETEAGDEDEYGNSIIKRISTDIDFLRASPLRKYF